MDGRMDQRKRECGGRAGVGEWTRWMETTGCTGGWPDGSVNVAGGGVSVSGPDGWMETIGWSGGWPDGSVNVGEWTGWMDGDH